MTICERVSAAKKEKTNVKNIGALAPAALFLALYTLAGAGGGTLCASLAAAAFFACIQRPKEGFARSLRGLARGFGEENAVTMALIFLTAGMFTGAAGEEGARSAAAIILAALPPRFGAAALFVSACAVSMAMGTSCGAAALLAPVAASVSRTLGGGLELCLAAVLGGAMFGDNLSFISDTTIAACGSQGCDMSGKFRANLVSALPAALITLVMFMRSPLPSSSAADAAAADLPALLPYAVVLALGFMGVNVFAVLFSGVAAAALLRFSRGVGLTELLRMMGAGAAGMFEIALAALLASGLCALMRERGGFDLAMNAVRRFLRGERSACFGIGMLAALLTAVTASNTIAIVICGPMAKELAKEWNIAPERSAAILDTFSCAALGALPYGAPMLYVLGAARALGAEAAVSGVMRYMYYPAALLACCSVSILLLGGAYRPKIREYATAKLSRR